MYKRLELIKALETNWNGYYSEPIPQRVIDRAEKLITIIDKQFTIHPSIHPTSIGSIQLEWTQFYPSKELSVGVIDTEEPEYDYLLSMKDQEREATVYKIEEVINIIKDFLGR